MILFQCFKLSQGEFYFTGGNLKIVCAESQTLNYAVVRQITENSFKARNFVEFTFSYHSDVFGVDVTFAGFKSFFLPTIMDTPAAPFPSLFCFLVNTAQDRFCIYQASTFSGQPGRIFVGKARSLP